MGINSKQAKQIPIRLLLEREGHQSVKQRGRQFFYNSPFREEKESSFNINVEDNTWYDFGEGEGGNILDLAMRLYQCDFKTALQKLQPLVGHQVSTVKINPHQKQLRFPNNPLFEIISINPLENNKLIEYLTQKRKLDIEICRHYLQEIYFRNIEKNKTYYAFGWKNQSGGYEIRNPYFKSVIGSKDINLYAQKESTQLYLFEGITDFLSLLSMRKEKSVKAQVIVLNSLSLLKKAQSWAQANQITSIACYFDNDEAGLKSGKKLTEKSLIAVELRNGYYQNFKDINDWWVAKNSSH